MNHKEIPTGWFLLPKGEKIFNGDMCTNDWLGKWEECNGLVGQLVGSVYCGSYICIRKGKAGPVPEKIWLNLWD